MKFKGILSVLLLLSICISTSTSAEALTIKMGTLAPEGSTWYNLLREMADEWKQASGGKVSIRIYAGGVTGDEPDMVRKMRIGQLQAAGISIEGLADIYSDLSVLQIPFLLTSNAELDYLMKKMSSTFKARIEKKGFVVLTWMDAGWVRLFSQNPIVTPADLTGLTMYVWGERSPMVDAWKSKGIKALGLSPTEIYPMLQAGKINAYSTTPIASLSFQWFALAPNMADMKLGALIGAMVVDKRTWKKIPADVRKKLRRITEEYGKKMVEATRSYEKEAIEVMQSHGLKVNHIPEKTLAGWRAYAEDVHPILLTTPGEKSLYKEISGHLHKAGKEQ
jgi:TRAP-type C4-dicarboxylate transport system substrate-binding protein